MRSLTPLRRWRKSTISTNNEHAALTALFRTLLHQLMTAQLRVHGLDLPEVEIAGVKSSEDNE